MLKIITLVENTPGNNNCLYEHGLSFYVETPNHKLLVDSGSTDIFLNNAKMLGVDLSQVDTMILSHGHYDHSGGILEFSKLNATAAIYMRKTAKEDYYHVSDTEERYIGIDKEILALSQCIMLEDNLEIDEELFLFSGISGRKFPIKGNLELKKKVDGRFVQDTFDHEQCLVITQGKQHILMSGCAHNGIVNILDRYMELFHSYPDIVISGFHMMQKEPYSSEQITEIENIAKELFKTKAFFYTGHCTGQEAFDIMKPIMGDYLRQIHSGDIIL